MNNFLQDVSLTRPRFSEEERTGTLVLKPLGITGRMVQSAASQLGLDEKGRWPLAREILSLAAIRSDRTVWLTRQTPMALGRNDPALVQVLGMNPDYPASPVVVLDSGVVYYEVRDVAVETLCKIIPPFSVRKGRDDSARLVVQPLGAYLESIQAAEWVSLNIHGAGP